MARNPENCCIPLGDWPKLDREAWQSAQEPADLLDPAVGQASRWSEATRQMIESGYGRWLGWLALVGELDPHERPWERATRDRVRRYLDALTAAELADYTLARRIQELSDGLKVMAPDQDFAWIGRGAWRIHAQAQPSKDLRPRLQPAERVLQLGLDMIQAADTDRFRGPVERACLFRDGLMIAFLTLRPLRSKNLTALTLGRHIQQRGDMWWVFAPGAEEKTGRDIECPWPQQLASALERYLEIHRPVLLRCSTKGPQAGEALWVSKQGTAMTSDALSYQVKSRTEEEFGEAINLHSFRHIAATTIATVDPENTAMVASILGHAGLHASDKHYNRGRTIDAGRRYQAELTAVRLEK